MERRMGQTTPDGNRPAAGSWWSRAGTLPQAAVVAVIVAASWYMLKELAPLLRPLLLAALICYVIVPFRSRLQLDRAHFKALVALAIGGAGVAAALVLLFYGSILELNSELPRLATNAQAFVESLRAWARETLPRWLSRAVDDFLRIETQGAQRAPDFGNAVLRYAADLVIETVVVALYVIFLIMESRRIPDRVRRSFDGARAEQILATILKINSAISDYLKSKTKASLILAAPVTLVLLAFGVKFALIWGMLTFLCNFIPYIGSFVGCGTPVAFAFLDLPGDWRPIVVAVLLVSIHITSSAFFEPFFIARAVGLSPLVILLSMTFWGLCWGIVGVLVAVPLTVAMKIVLTNIEATRPLAEGMGG
jgi:AI-2 transport protein TqsA